MNREVLDAFTYFAERMLQRLHSDKPFADWMEAFYSGHVEGFLSDFDASLVKASQLPPPQCWREGWAALSRLEQSLKEIEHEFRGNQVKTETEKFMAEIREQYSLF